MSNWVVNASSAIPFTGSLASSINPYVYNGDQTANLEQGQTLLPEAITGRGLHGALGSEPQQPTVGASWTYQNLEPSHLSWPSGHLSPGQRPVISGVLDTGAVQVSLKEDMNSQSRHDNEVQRHEARALCEQQQEEGRIMLAEVERLTSKLASERQRSDELSRQLLTVSAAHQTLQVGAVKP